MNLSSKYKLKSIYSSIGLDNRADNDEFKKLPMFLVLLILSPDYLVIFAYLLLVWQLHSFHQDGYAA